MHCLVGWRMSEQSMQYTTLYIAGSVWKYGECFVLCVCMRFAYMCMCPLACGSVTLLRDSGECLSRHSERARVRGKPQTFNILLNQACRRVTVAQSQRSVVLVKPCLELMQLPWSSVSYTERTVLD